MDALAFITVIVVLFAIIRLAKLSKGAHVDRKPPTLTRRR